MVWSLTVSCQDSDLKHLTWPSASSLLYIFYHWRFGKSTILISACSADRYINSLGLWKIELNLSTVPSLTTFLEMFLHAEIKASFSGEAGNTRRAVKTCQIPLLEPAHRPWLRDCDILRTSILEPLAKVIPGLDRQMSPPISFTLQIIDQLGRIYAMPQCGIFFLTPHIGSDTVQM